MNSSHIILGLAGGLMPNGALPWHARQRVDACVSRANETGGSIIFSSSFTLNKRVVLDNEGRPLSEASVMASVARGLGFSGQIYCEQQSHDTIGSLYFIFRNFVEDMLPTHISLVTSAFHMPRSRVIFHHIAKLFGYETAMLDEVVSDYLSEPSREAREAQSLEYYRTDWCPINSRAEFAQKLFTEHANYNERFGSDFIARSSDLLY